MKNEIVNLIDIHKKIYYNGLKELVVNDTTYYPISDIEFDEMETELKKIDSENSILQKVGTDYLTGDKVKHDRPMLSIEKVKESEGTGNIEKLLNNGRMLATHKMDGSACSLKFSYNKDNKCQFQTAATRGDGEQGEYIRQHAEYINFPKEFGANSSIDEIRGEVVISKDNFEELKKEMKKLGLEEPESIRNIVSGLLHRKEHKYLCQWLDFIAYDFFTTESINYFDKLRILNSLGFKTPISYNVTSNADINKVIEQYKQSKESEYYLTDGIVFRVNDSLTAEKLGRTSGYYKHSLAYKVASDTAIVTLKKRERSVNRTGKISYVGIYDSIYLGGANLTRVTLHNAKNLIDNEIGIGSKILITRSNEIIPFFIKTIEPSEVNLEMNCPCCNSELKWSESMTDLVCHNEDCSDQKLERLIHFVKEIGIDNLGQSTVKKLYDFGYLENYSDFFNITEAAFLNIEGFQKKSAKKLFEAIQDKKVIKMEKFLSALSIDGLGHTVSKDIKNEFKTIFNLMNCNELEQKLTSIDGIGDRISHSIVNLMDYIKKIHESLISIGCKIEDVDENIQITESVYTGKKFIISGSTEMGKKELYDIVKTFGGVQVSTVKQCDYLITNEQHNKYQEAVKYGKQILTEKEFIDSI